ncbi:HAMP domain-containing protein [Halieaceae bacterium IMCC14734]|uniref:HAMP domain-containing protein n=1 Tax=Candidatus Litorirhabdus singularis TaxID=2518993 RepID=A0ABT3TC74_9GAMM|nr:SpoIIE family protein phosphatase [Candidatus Litorirhabdus singularis]MCX2979871.1 HAMP domain-containing protein [Candidatus Litorirhabdus singularis]
MSGHSLATRLSYLLAACIAGMALLTTLVDYQLSRRVILEQVAADTSRIINDTRYDLDAQLRGVEQATRLFAQLLARQQYAPDEIKQQLRIMVESRTDIFGGAVAVAPAYTADYAGFAPYYYRPPSGPLTYLNLAESMSNYSDQPWFKDTANTGRPHWSEPYYDAGGGETLMATYSVPLYRADTNGRSLIGVVTTDLALTSLSSQLEGLQLGEAGFALLLSRRGMIIAGPANALLMQPLLNMLPAGQDPQVWQTLLDSAANAMPNSSPVPCIRQDGDCLVHMTPLATTGWPLGVYYSETEMLAPLRSLLLRMALSELASLMLVLVLVHFLSRQLTRPLAALVSVTDNIARGYLDAPLPRTPRDDEVGRLVRSFAAMQRNLREHIAKLQRETASRNRLEGELDAARDIQYAMIPDAGSTRVYRERVSLWAELRPARSVGGDFYWYRLAGQQLLIVVGDVSDKGVPAALFMSRAITLLQQHAATASDPSLLMAALNDELCEGNDNCMFVTLFCGIIDLDSLVLRFASGGHTPASLVREGQSISLDQDTGPALGLQDEQDFPINEVQLKATDRLVVFTDGIDEAFNPAKEQLGLDRFNQLLGDGYAQVIEQAGAEALMAVERHADGEAQSDDITLLLLDLMPAKTKDACYQIPAPAAAKTSTEVTPVADGTIGPLLDWLQAQTAGPLSDAAQGELMLVTEEAVTNAIRYGRLADDSAIAISLVVFPDYLLIQISDPGIAFNPLEEAKGAELGLETAAAPIGGLGVHLLKTLTDHQSYQRQADRNILRLTKTLPSAEEKHGIDHSH